MNGRIQSEEIGKGNFQSTQHFVFAPDAPVALNQSNLIQEYERRLVVNTVSQPVLRLPGKTTSQSSVWTYPESTSQFHIMLADAKTPLARGYPELLKAKNRIPYHSLLDLHLAMSRTHPIHSVMPGDIVVIWQPAANEFRERYGLEVVPGHEFDISYSLFVHPEMARRPATVAAFIRLFVMGWNFIRAHRNRAVELLTNSTDYWTVLLSGAGISLDRLIASSSAINGEGESRLENSGISSVNDGRSETSLPHFTGSVDRPDRSEMSRKTKRSTERGEARCKLISALTKHHQYSDGFAFNVEPIASNSLARMAMVVKSTSSQFFKNEFGGYGKYRFMCSDSSKLIAALKLLNGEFPPSILFKSQAIDKDYRDDD